MDLTYLVYHFGLAALLELAEIDSGLVATTTDGVGDVQGTPPGYNTSQERALALMALLAKSFCCAH